MLEPSKFHMAACRSPVDKRPFVWVGDFHISGKGTFATVVYPKGLWVPQMTAPSALLKVSLHLKGRQCYGWNLSLLLLLLLL